MSEVEPKSEFPLYKMVIEEEEHWLPLHQAGRIYDSGMLAVSIGGLVLDEAGPTRKITDRERSRICDIADDYSASQ